MTSTTQGVKSLNSRSFQPAPVEVEPRKTEQETAALHEDIQIEREKRLAELEFLIHRVREIKVAIEIDVKRAEKLPTVVRSLKGDRAHYRRVEQALLATADLLKIRS